MIVLSERATEIERREREANRARLLALALEYSAKKTEAHWQSIRGMRIRAEPREKLGAPKPPKPVEAEAIPIRRSSPHSFGKAHVVDGVGRTMREWAAYRGVTPSGLHHLIRRHGSLEAALQAPRRIIASPEPGVGQNLP